MLKEIIQKRLDEYFVKWEDELHEATETDGIEAFRHFLSDDNDAVFDVLEKYV